MKGIFVEYFIANCKAFLKELGLSPKRKMSIKFLSLFSRSLKEVGIYMCVSRWFLRISLKLHPHSRKNILFSTKDLKRPRDNHMFLFKDQMCFLLHSQHKKKVDKGEFNQIHFLYQINFHHLCMVIRLL